MNARYLLATICLFSVLFSCKKDINQNPAQPNEPTFNIPAPSPIAGRVTGIVVDENNTPVQNAEVVLSGATYMTDANGFFNIENASLDKYVSTVVVNKAGYFKAVRSWSATASRNYLSIKLIPKTLIGNVDAAGGGSVSLSNGTAITFQSNSIVVKATGAAYTGTVKLYATYIDPTASDIAATVPGSMMAQDANKMFILQSAGMIAVELESDAGQPLQIAIGRTAAIKLPIPSSILSKVPATIDTWSLNDQGIWIKEGTATKNGNFYEMQVSHFSFWNCDYSIDPTFITIHIHDQNGNPLPNVTVQLSIVNNPSWWGTTYGITDSSGTVAGLVPVGQDLLMSLFPDVYNCVSLISSQNIGPFTNDTTLNITVNLSQSNTSFTVVNGTLVDCSNNPLLNGVVGISDGMYHYYSVPVSNGSYTLTLPYCGTTSITVVASDNTGGSASSGSIPVTGNTVTVPAMTVCNLNPNAVYNIVSCQSNGTYTEGILQDSTNYIMAIVEVLSTGPYDFQIGFSGGPNLFFQALGTFTHTGLDTMYLYSLTTPVLAGTYPIQMYSNGTTCNCSVVVNPLLAIFGCLTYNITFGYYAGVTLSGQAETLTVDVASVGSYNVTTNTVNGISFSGSGYFSSIGQHPLILTGSGTPISAGTFTYTPTGVPAGGCGFPITVN